jgi:transcription-repair coupling factor (superfamily II helicase)
MGFVQAPTVTEPGDYAVRGGIIDIYPPGRAGRCGSTSSATCSTGAAVRCGDPADHRDARPGRACAGLRGHPRRGRDHAVPAELPDRVRRRRHRRPALRGGQRGAQASGGWSTGCPSSMTGWRRCSTTCPARPSRSTTRRRPRAIARWDMIADQYDTRRQALSQKARLDTSTNPCRRGCSTSTTRPGRRPRRARRVVQFSPCRRPPGPGVIDAGGRIGRDFAPERQQESVSLFGAWRIMLKRLAERPVVVASYSEGARERLKGLMEDEGLRPAPDRHRYRGGRISAQIRHGNSRGLHLAVWALEQGFEGPRPHRHLRTGRPRRPPDPRAARNAGGPRTS